MVETQSIPSAGFVEKIVQTDIRNPETSGVSRTFRFVGKVDQVYFNRESGMVILRDWKTCANAAQTERLKMLSFQADLYACAIEDLGFIVDAAEFCLIERPSIRLCGKDANAAAYEARCLEWLKQEGKLVQFYIPSTRERRLNARRWLWDISKQILEARRAERFVCNEQACYNWQRECPYMPLCLARAQGHDWRSVLVDDYVLAPLHPELEGYEGRADLLTYSAASCFVLCQAKYEWRYEMAIRPKVEESSDALNAGINVHKGLELALTTGLDSGLASIPDVLGIDEKGVQDRAKARAMVRAAFEKWG